MKKVLIISYYFPPANFVGAERTAAWAKYLKEMGYYPIILTRCWNEGQTDPLEKVCKNELVHEKHETHEVYRLPVRRTLRDKISAYPWLATIQKALTLAELILANYFIRSLPYVSIYRKAQELLKADPGIKVVIASGRPFQSFFVGHRLKKEFDIRWIPDYRDEWNSHQNPTNSGLIWNFVKRLEAKSELRWTNNADGFTTVSENWKNSISTFNHKEGTVVMNGYDAENQIPLRRNKGTRLNVLYAGTLYPSQNISVFIDAVLKLPFPEETISVEFIGANIIPEELERLTKAIKESKVFHFTNRVNREKLHYKMAEADILILTSFEKIKGWYPVKLFEYYASGKPILLCPSDHDVMEEFVLKTNSGLVANTVEECEAILNQWIAMKQKGEPILFERNIKEGEKYSRRYQTKILAQHLDNLYKK
ncbi:MAG: glycosyltransferase [Bacteroidetes bacterium]|nr:MAG: glycosyltransferase [Bacteroidota bacterium]